MSRRLRNYACDEFSQWGEDGIIMRIMEADRGFLQENPDQYVVEVGAYDGHSLSNTCRLWKDQGMGAVLIENDPRRFAQLERFLSELGREYDPRMGPAGQVRAVQSKLEPDGPCSLLRILAGEGDPYLLSLDIDGNEYQVLESMACRPRVIVAEFNPTMPLRSRWVGPLDAPVGSSLGALDSLLRTRGYRLAEWTKCNGIFVASDLAIALELNDYDLGLSEWDESDLVTVEVSDYVGGGYFRMGPASLPYGRGKPINYKMREV